MKSSRLILRSDLAIREKEIRRLRTQCAEYAQTIHRLLRKIEHLENDLCAAHVGIANLMLAKRLERGGTQNGAHA